MNLGTNLPSKLSLNGKYNIGNVGTWKNDFTSSLLKIGLLKSRSTNL